MKINFVKIVSKVSLLVILVALFFLFFTACGTKKITTTIATEKVEENTETSSVEVAEKVTEAKINTITTPEIKENTETPIATDKEGKVKSFHKYKKIGNIEFWWGVNNGKYYERFFKPESTEITTDISVIENNTKNESSNYVSITDKSIISFIKIIRSKWNFKLWFLVIGMGIFIFRKQLLWLLSLIFPQAKFIKWIVSFFGSPQTKRTSNIENRLSNLELNIETQTNSLTEILGFIKNIKPGLIE